MATKFQYLDNFMNFIFADGSISIHVVQAKCPLQLLPSLSSWGEVQSDNVLLKVKSPVCIGVKTPEHVPGIFCGISVGEKTGVDALKLLLADLSARTLLQERLVPGAQLGLGVLCVGFQVLQELLWKCAAFRVPHPGCKLRKWQEPLQLPFLFVTLGVLTCEDPCPALPLCVQSGKQDYGHHYPNPDSCLED